MSLIPDRIVTIPGEGLLPACYEPQIPLDIKENERVRVIPPSPPWRPVSSEDLILVMEQKSPQDQRYWFIGSAHEERLPSFEWDFAPHAKSKVLGFGEGLDSLPDDTVIKIDAPATKISLPDLWEPFGDQFMVASARLKAFIEAQSQNSIDSRRVIIRDSENSEISRYYFIDVIKNISAIDIANSIVDYRGAVRHHPPRLQKYVSSRIRGDIDPDLHIFRQKSFSGSGGYMVIVDDGFRAALIAQNPMLSNIRFDACGGAA